MIIDLFKKRITFPVLAFAILLFTGCNDGDLDIERVDFSDTSVSSCNDFTQSGLLFKISDNEALILELPANFIGNRVTQDSIESQIPNNSALYYRFFDGPVSSEYFCNSVAPATPSVRQEVIATGGLIRAMSTPASNGSGFNHGIVVHGAVLQNAAGETLIEDYFRFGTFTTTPPSAGLGEEYGNIVHCNDTLLYKPGTTSTGRGIAIVLNLEEGLLRNEVTEEDNPVTSAIGEDSKVYFHIFEEPIPDNYFCTNSPEEGAKFEALGGRIEIVTSENENGNGFVHQINFREMLLVNNNGERLVAANAAFGSYTTSTSEP